MLFLSGGRAGLSVALGKLDIWGLKWDILGAKWDIWGPEWDTWGAK